MSFEFLKKLYLQLGKASICLFLLAFLISSCTFRNSYINRNEDIQAGITVLNRFYSNVQDKRLHDIETMESDTLKFLIGQSGMGKILNLVNKKVGSYKSHVISESYTEHLNGSNIQTIYKYKLKVTYDNGVIDEIIGLNKQGNSDIKIISYNVYSDLLIN